MLADDARTWAREVKERIAQVSDWRDRGLCQACGEEMATRQLPNLHIGPGFKADPVNLCATCEKANSVQNETVPIHNPHITPPLRVPIL